MTRTYVLSQDELDYRLMLARCETLRLAIRRFKHGAYPPEKRSKMGRELEELIEREWRRLHKRIEVASGVKRSSRVKARVKSAKPRQQHDLRKRRSG